MAVVVRCVVSFGVCQYYYITKVWYFTPGLSQIGEEKFREEEENEEYDHRQGQKYDDSKMSKVEVES